MAGLLGSLLGSVVPGGSLITGLIQGGAKLFKNAQIGKAATQAGFTQGLTTPGQQQTLNQSTQPGFLGMSMNVVIGIGLFILMVIILIFTLLGRKR